MDARCRIEMLGGLRLEQRGRIVTRFRTRKTAELLAYLAYYCHRAHPREALIELLWPEDDIDAGRHSLSMALSALRPHLEPPGVTLDGAVLGTDRHSVRLNPTAVTTDVLEFETALRFAARVETEEERISFLTAAVELYAGELLPGYYDDWIFPEQQRLEELYFQALRHLIGHFERAGDFDRALPHALRSVGANRLREEAHQEVIRLYLAAGHPDAAQRQYRELERILQQELAATPDEKTRALLRAAPSPEPQVPQQRSRVPITEPGSAPSPSLVIPLLRSECLEPIGGAVPLGSTFYVVRPTDAEFHAAIARRDSIVLVKGAHQVGKTSLLARGLQQGREAGSQVVLTHFQVFNAAHLESAETLLLALADTIAEQLDLDVRPADVWDTRRGPNPNFRRYLRREVLDKLSTPLVWGLDEVDRLFSCTFGSEIFGLFRSWHDERALEPGGPWERLTLAIAYSTEAHLFITDVNQSPFNVGTRLTLDDFTLEQVADLNRRYGAPLRDAEDVARYYALVHGQPYLVRRGLHEMVAHGANLSVFEERASSDDWVFGEHLRRIVVLLARNTDLSEVVRAVLDGKPCPSRESFYRLRSAGILSGESVHDARFRCPLYAAYLKQHLL